MERLGLDINLPRRDFDLRISLTVGSESLALIGPSGAGKTSLLRSIAGLERPREGRIWLGDAVWFDAGERRDVRPEDRRVGYLPQDYGLFPHMTVAGNVRFVARRDRPDLLRRLELEHLADSRPGQLSGGERQRVGLARALARDPRVLLLDEPFAALDAITRRLVRDELARLLPELALPAVLVTHSFEDAVAVGNRVGVIDRGRLVQLDSPDEILRKPATALVASLTGANVLAGTASPAAGGSRIRLDDGGELLSADRATGRVRVAVQPWDLRLTAPADGSVVDTVISVHERHGGWDVRLARLQVHAPSDDHGAPAITPGAAVGVCAAPDRVRVLAAC